MIAYNANAVNRMKYRLEQTLVDLHEEERRETIKCASVNLSEEELKCEEVNLRQIRRERAHAQEEIETLIGIIANANVMADILVAQNRMKPWWRFW
ncbi:MAG: hypothetical protein JXQ99_21190 [Hyphomicrobiaceae bacterium]